MFIFFPQQPTSDTGDEPLFVNAKQYHRILKRREARAKLESQGKIPKERQVRGTDTTKAKRFLNSASKADVQYSLIAFGITFASSKSSFENFFVTSICLRYILTNIVYMLNN